MSSQEEVQWLAGEVSGRAATVWGSFCKGLLTR